MFYSYMTYLLYLTLGSQIFNLLNVLHNGKLLKFPNISQKLNELFWK